jgi:hypothetical protein
MMGFQQSLILGVLIGRVETVMIEIQIYTQAEKFGMGKEALWSIIIVMVSEDLT